MFALPPTLDQLGFGISSSSLWLVRLFSLASLLVSTYILSRLVNFKVKKYYWIIVVASPVFLLLWMLYPIDCIKILIISLSLYIISRFNKNLIIRTAATGLIIILINIFVFKQKPALISIVNLDTPGQEVINRFNVEDTLTSPIYIPLQIKRITYNKLFLGLKDLTNESLNFFDFETLFFQDVHPLSQKGFVIFFWPQIYIFAVGAWLAINKKIKLDKNYYLLVLGSFVYFLTADVSADRRLVFLLFPLSILMCQTIKISLTAESKIVRFGITVLLILSLYGLLTFHYDLSARPAYWLDNRPLAYQFVFSNLPKLQSNFNHVLMPDTLYAAKQYCHFYRQDCSKIEIVNFDLSKQQINSDTLYIGFLGNFTGPNPDNSITNDFENKLSEMGLKVYNQTYIHDNIANGFGQNLIIASK